MQQNKKNSYCPLNPGSPLVGLSPGHPTRLAIRWDREGTFYPGVLLPVQEHLARGQRTQSLVHCRKEAGEELSPLTPLAWID